MITCENCILEKAVHVCEVDCLALEDALREHDRQIIAEIRAEIHSELMLEMAELNGVKMNEKNLMTFAYRIKQIAEKLEGQK